MVSRNRLEAQKAPSWLTKTNRPVKGDILAGTVVNLATGTSDYGDYTIVTVGFTGHPDDLCTRGLTDNFAIKTADGEVKWDGKSPLAWHAIGTVADNEVTKVDPHIGDLIGIMYDGTGIAQKGQGAGKSYDIWRVAVDRAAAYVVPVRPVTTVEDAKLPADGYAAADDEEPF